MLRAWFPFPCPSSSPQRLKDASDSGTVPVLAIIPCHCRASLVAISFLRTHEEWIKMLYPQGFSKWHWRKQRHAQLRYLMHESTFLQLWGRCFGRELSYAAVSEFPDMTSLATSFTKSFPIPLLNWLSLCSTSQVLGLFQSYWFACAHLFRCPGPVLSLILAINKSVARDRKRKSVNFEI